MSIRKLVTAAIAAVALTAGSASAETALSYYINGQVDFSQIDAGAAGDDDFTNYGVNGAVAFGVATNVGMQIDVAAAIVDEDLSNDDVYTGTAHLFHRTASGLIGGFLGVAGLGDDSAWGGGVEGKLYKGDWTLGADLTYATVDDTDTDLWAIGGDAEYFYNDNLSSSFGLGFGNIDGAGGNSDFWTANVGVNYQLASAPVGFSARLGYVNEDDLNADATTLSLGVNYVFSGESLHERNQSGASQKGFLSSLIAAVL